jgi:hypothetical protein
LALNNSLFSLPDSVKSETKCSNRQWDRTNHANIGRRIVHIGMHKSENHIDCSASDWCASCWNNSKNLSSTHQQRYDWIE